MRTHQFKRPNCGWLVLFAMIVLLFGCEKKKNQATAPPAAPPPPAVTVYQVQAQTVPIYLKYIGSTEAVNTVDIRARVQGYLLKTNFKEGANIRAGDIVFEIDPREYQARLDQSRAQLAKDQAALAFARDQVKRYRPLTEQELTPQETLDDYITQEKEAAAAIKADQAQIEEAALDLSYCTIRTPINGRIGRMLVNVGNLVGAGENTRLATVVQLDPIYVYFNPSQLDLRMIQKSRKSEDLPVQLTFSDGADYPHAGKIDFIDNMVNRDTSTISMRAVAPNPDGDLLPGIYMNVSLFVNDAPNTILAPQNAFGEDQAGTFVYVVDRANQVQQNHVTVGDTYKGMKIVTKGLQAGDRVLTEGLQRVRPGMTVDPKTAPPKS